jgi:hypothetical protein
MYEEHETTAGEHLVVFSTAWWFPAKRTVGYGHLEDLTRHILLL